jgi:hypothetical protein
MTDRFDPNRVDHEDRTRCDRAGRHVDRIRLTAHPRTDVQLVDAASLARLTTGPIDPGREMLFRKRRVLHVNH